MKKLIWLQISILILIISSCNTQIKEENKNSHLLQSVLWFQSSAEMKATFYQAYNLAKLRLSDTLSKLPADKKYAMVMDIDETVLDNSPFEGYMIKHNKEYTYESWKEWVNQKNADPLPGAKGFVDFAYNLGIEVFYISNRRDEDKQATIENLTLHDFYFADEEHVLLKTNTSNKDARRQHVSETHTILLFIGDNLGDFSSVFDLRTDNLDFDQVDSLQSQFGKSLIILPNPMYGGWTKPLYNNQQDISLEEKIASSKSKIKSFK